MSICWYCHHGWPKPVADIYDAALAKLGGDKMPLDYGPGHIVWADENFDTRSVQWCLDHFDKHRGDLSDEDSAIVRHSLEQLLAVPEEIRCCEPEDYDGKDPAKYPPPAGMEMVKKR